MKLPSSYEPQQYEADIYHLWEQSGAFKPSQTGKDYFSVVFPPPNANGDLHIGHALTTAIQDSLVRYHRMQGRAALFVPGADHAGFETWVVYEKKLSEQGKSRFDFSREELYRQVWEFVETNRQNFESQLRALGGSFDWSKFTFTLDPKVVETAYSTFQKMWEEGLIYRGKRIVNFCTFHGTSFSDIEVIHEEEDTKLWYIAYPLVDGSGEVVIATTRPETKLGQAALMVNPGDERYKQLVGKEVKQPLVPDKPIKIIADEYVDMKFGTGVVTVTPGHDPNDFEVAQRHNLPITELITPEGKMSQNVPEPFRGLTVMEARPAVEQALSKAGYLRKAEPYRHSVGKCYKCGTPIEPLVREQWFVSMRPLADKAIAVLKADKITFYPKSKKQQVIKYMEEVRDWNISRQIPWGIPIPAFVNTSDPADWIFDSRVDQQTIEVDGKTYQRDQDVFDTWFSSGQWPYVTLNYPDGEDFKNFYPTSLMETGGEILYQWVARMIMMGLYVTDEIPFKTVYIHGYVLAEDGAKMSKSLGNVINPVDIISEYGSDALRMGLLTGRRPGINQGYHPSKIKAGRNFANKLWNIARFIESKMGDQTLGHQAQPSSLADHWFAAKLNETTAQMKKALETYRLSEAYDLLYQFIWRDFADWYLEANKIQPNVAMLAYGLEASLKITHPFAPFVTEAIWQTLMPEQGSLLATQQWAEPVAADSQKAAAFQDLADIISEARRMSAAVGVSQPVLIFRNSSLLADNSQLVKALGRLGEVRETTEPKRTGIRIAKLGYDAWLDVDSAKTKAYIDKLLEAKNTKMYEVDRLENRLAAPGYTDKAPPEIVKQTSDQIAAETAMLDQIKAEIDTISKAVSS